MKLFKYVAALLLALALLYLAKSMAMGKPEVIRKTENGFTFEFTTVPSASVSDTMQLHIKIDGLAGKNIRPLLRHSGLGQSVKNDPRNYFSVPLSPDSVIGEYHTQIISGQKGERVNYYFELRDNVGGRPAMLMAANQKPFSTKASGLVPTAVLIGHVALIFATVFFVTLAAFESLPLLSGEGNSLRVRFNLFLAVLVTFLGGYPFGFAINWYTNGVLWEGIPFGTDATDNKTQLLFFYLLFVTLLYSNRRSNSEDASGPSPRTLGLFGLSSLVVLLAIYLIPHSIQFDPSLTKVVCYSFLIALVGVYSFVRLRNSEQHRQTKLHERR